MDYIFIIGPSAVGKTMLAKSLFRHYRGVLLDAVLKLEEEQDAFLHHEEAGA